MINCKKQNDTLVYELDTNINEENAAKIANTISVEMELSENISKLALDFKNVDFIDNSTIGLLIYLQKKIKDIEIFNCNKSIAMAIKISGVKNVTIF
jgi:anti-anti-sigma factor